MAIRRLYREEYARVLSIFDGEASVSSLSSSEELHQLAWNYNWDDGEKTMEQVIHHPNCDQGTALLVYWHNTPASVYEYGSREEMEEWAVGGYDLAKEIERLYLSGFYTMRNIQFAPEMTTARTGPWKWHDIH